MHKERETERKRTQRQKNKGNEFVHSSFDFEINGPFKNRIRKCRAVFQLKQALPKSPQKRTAVLASNHPETSTNKYCCSRRIEIGVRTWNFSSQ